MRHSNIAGVFLVLAGLLGGGSWYLYKALEETTPLTILITDWPGEQVFAFADFLGVAPKFGLDLDIRRIASVDDTSNAYLRGNTDIITLSLDYAIGLGRSDTRIIYAYDHSVGADGIVGNGEFRSMADLRGRKIGVEFGFPNHFLVLKALERAGMTAEDVVLVDVQSDKALDAMRSGEIAAMGTWHPILNDILQQVPGAHLLVSTRDFPELIYDVVIVKEQALRNNRQQYVQLIRAIDLALTECRADWQGCMERLSQETGAEAGAWEANFDGVVLLDLEANRRLFVAEGRSEMQNRLADVYDFLKRINPELETPQFDAWIDGSLIVEASLP